jgi:hypothetical protein
MTYDIGHRTDSSMLRCLNDLNTFQLQSTPLHTTLHQSTLLNAHNPMQIRWGHTYPPTHTLWTQPLLCPPCPPCPPCPLCKVTSSRSQKTLRRSRGAVCEGEAVPSAAPPSLSLSPSPRPFLSPSPSPRRQLALVSSRPPHRRTMGMGIAFSQARATLSAQRAL